MKRRLRRLKEIEFAPVLALRVSVVPSRTQPEPRARRSNANVTVPGSLSRKLILPPDSASLPITGARFTGGIAIGGLTIGGLTTGGLTTGGFFTGGFG